MLHRGGARSARYSRCSVGRAAAGHWLLALNEMCAIASQGASRQISVTASLAPHLLLTLWRCQPLQWKHCDILIIPARMVVTVVMTMLLYDDPHTCLPVNKRFHLLLGKWGRGRKEKKPSPITELLRQGDMLQAPTYTDHLKLLWHSSIGFFNYV